jgi:DNA-binding GntR family transcriptional regulator
MLPSLPYTHKQLRNLVADRLRSMILDGHLKPGEWLRQERLALELGVSQMPVREALKELAAEGLIEHVPYRGARVIEFSPEDVHDLYEHRAFLESMAARIAAPLISAEDLAELRRLQKLMEENLAPEKLALYREHNRRFHQVVYQASQREYLIRTLNQMWAAFPTMLTANFPATASRPLPERDSSDITEHQAILHALETHDAEAAESLIHQHIKATGQQLVQAMREVNRA